jgi:threonine dehydrogenase-like Zn-dependent dehydrogenase
MPARVLRSTGSGRRPVEDIHTSLTPLATAEANLVRLAEQAHRDLDALAHPAAAWVRPVAGPGGEPVAEVVIVGAGQAGLIVGLALKREGVRKIVHGLRKHCRAPVRDCESSKSEGKCLPSCSLEPAGRQTEAARSNAAQSI